MGSKIAQKMKLYNNGKKIKNILYMNSSKSVLNIDRIIA